MKLRRFVCVCLLILLCLGFFGGFTPQPFNISIQPVHGATEPTDQDAWIENNNATYAWTHYPSHKDNTISWASTDKKVGSYSLNNTHTDNEARMSIFLEANSSNLLNVTQYDVLVFWAKITKSGWSGSLSVYLANDRGAAWYKYDRFKIQFYLPKEGEWFKVAVPVKAFEYQDKPLGSDLEPYGFKYLYFEVSGLTNADNAELLLDGLHFATFDYQDNSNSLDYKLLPNLMALVLSETKIAVYNGTSYTSAYSMRALNGSHQYESLEMETIGQLLYAGSLIYDKTKWEWLYDDYLTKWATWLLQAQYSNSSSIGYGSIFNSYNNGTGQFADQSRATYLGWELAGLSAFYDVNSSSTVKNKIELLRGFLIDDLWDDANDWFDVQFVRSTNSITDQASWASMSQGAMATGLGAYLRWVSSNSTVESVLNQLLSKGLTTSTRNKFIIGSSEFFEDNMYVRHGLYQAYEATGNTTYYNHFLNTSNIAFANNHLSTNGSMYRSLEFYGDGSRSAKFDGWGMACALPLLMWQYDLSVDSNLLNLVEQILFDTFSAEFGTNDYGIHRHYGVNAGDWANQQYLPSTFFTALALIEYFDVNPISTPYVAATNVRAGITSHSWSNNKLTFTVNASSGTTSTTKVYCGDIGKPITIYSANGTLTWSYNASTKTLELSVMHHGPAEIIVDWRMPGDVNCDGHVDLDDLYYVLIAYGMTIEDAMATYGVPEGTDIDNDGLIDLDDLYQVLWNYGA